MERKLGIVFASGATNRICCLAAALTSRYRFYVHLANEGLVAFRQDVLPRLLRYLLYVETYLKKPPRSGG